MTTEVAQILGRVQRGEAKAADELLPLVYDELRKLAAHKTAGGPYPSTHSPRPAGLAPLGRFWLRPMGSSQTFLSRRGRVDAPDSDRARSEPDDQQDLAGAEAGDAEVASD